MLIEGFGIGGYKSFGPELQKVGPCAKVNLLVGQNNSGKSNILLFLKHHYHAAIQSIRNSTTVNFSTFDRHMGSEDGLRFAVALHFAADTFEELNSTLNDRTKGLVDDVLRTDALTSGDPVAWFVFSEPKRGRPLVLDEQLRQKVGAQAPLSVGDWSELYTSLTGNRGGSPEEVWIPDVLTTLATRVFASAKVALIPAIRRVDKGSVSDDEHSA